MINKKPNVIIVMDDQHHYRYFGFMGHPALKTPNFDEFAKENVIFSNAFTSCPLCTPARVSLLSGMYPHATQIYSNNPNVRIREDIPLLPNTLRSHGYYTGTTGKYHADPLGHAQWDFKDDMESYNDFLKARGKERAACYLGPSYEKYPSPSVACSISPVSEQETRTAYEAKSAMDFLDARPKEKPFFLWMNFDAPHGPYHLTEKYARMYDPDDIPLPEYPKDKYDALPPEQREWASFRSYDTMTDEQLRRALAFYCGAVSEVDYHFGTVIKRLKAEGLYDNTIIIFLADHGDHAGDHRWVNKSFAYDSTIRIPLIVHIPGLLPQTCDELVQNVDIFQTLCDILDIPKPEFLQGNSFANMLGAGKSNAFRPRNHIISEELHYRTIRTKQHKLVYAPPCHAWDGGAFTSRLYDLKNDPDEWSDILGLSASEEIKHQLIEQLLAAYCSSELPLGGELQKISCDEHFNAYGQAYSAQRGKQKSILSREVDDFVYEAYLPSRQASEKPSLGGG